ncbi:recombinase family protein [Megasphaera elsdenii]|uniref:Site-specific recombinase n=1 Tax=Megasphaera elsdenii DSM 20460 TaxID=1064535 RepID=G0VLN5_MEGEL|nr:MULTISPECIES: recombinase family protein [Megasphaera]AVO75076.1 recombinase family protein [Megasphaera elsdenii DSM 20460]MCQ4113338.1 recombinase family protein [Megasphaera sp. SC8-1]CCC74233.1 site-specific recombinase [Megasphaera elsdenii DSM 20460]
MRKVTKIEQATSAKVKLKKIKVAAYCRVSTDSDAQLESLEAQKTHYENYITSRDDWEFAGLYYDEGITGTKKDKRPELLRLIDDCKAGKVDFIITKSISRFSRNTTDCLELVRKLLALRIPIFFEKENINTGSMESELFLAILSSMAEGESVSISENSKWSIQKRFENGTFKCSYPPYGYDWNGEQMVVNPEQAAVVKEIFTALLSGKGTHAIADDLNQRGVPSKRGGRWTATTIRGMLSNEKYVGDCLFQKTYSDSQFVRHSNHGEQAQYMVRDHHEPIISREDFEAAQAFVKQRASEKGVVKGTEKYQNRYVFSGKIICGECDDTFKRRIHSCTGYKYAAWCCNTHIVDKNRCHMLFVKDEALKLAFITMMNKLIFSHRLILKPYLEAIKNVSTDDSLRRIQQIQTLLTQNTEKRETLTKLMTQGIIDPVLYSQETNELLSQADTFRDEIDALKNTVSGDVTKVTEATALMHFAEKSAMLHEFDVDLFERFVKRIIVHSRNDIRFELKCGLTLRERK